MAVTTFVDPRWTPHIVTSTGTSGRTITFNDTTAKAVMTEQTYVLCACGACLDPPEQPGDPYVCHGCGRVWLVTIDVREATR